MLKLFIGKVIFSILITKFKLRRFCFAKNFLEGIKIFKIIDECRTFVIGAFINRAVFTMFPSIKSIVTVRTLKFSFVSNSAM